MVSLLVFVNYVNYVSFFSYFDIIDFHCLLVFRQPSNIKKACLLSLQAKAISTFQFVFFFAGLQPFHLSTHSSAVLTNISVIDSASILTLSVCISVATRGYSLSFRSSWYFCLSIFSQFTLFLLTDSFLLSLTFEYEEYMPQLERAVKCSNDYLSLFSRQRQYQFYYAIYNL